MSETWSIPAPLTGVKRGIIGGWDLAAVATIQSGSALTIANTNANNAFGISEDRAQLSFNCAPGQWVSSGKLSSKLNNHFNPSCFTSPHVIGADDIGTAFGDSRTGVIDGPGSGKSDVAFAKTIAVPWLREKGAIEFRAEFFNLFNHSQFANPDTNYSSPTFGVISSTAVNLRVGQSRCGSVSKGLKVSRGGHSRVLIVHSSKESSTLIKSTLNVLRLGMFLANGRKETYLFCASKHIGSNIRTPWPVTKVFREFLFFSVRSRHTGLNRHLRHTHS
jgi:hypothetical protein